MIMKNYRSTAAQVLLWIATWPYFWNLHHFTIIPIRRMVDAQHNDTRLQIETKQFINGKLNEIKLVTLAVSSDASNQALHASY